MLTVTNVNKTYIMKTKRKKYLFASETTEKQALQNISFDMKEGQALACIGENGAGKSTLIKCALGILSPTSGSVRLFGEDPRYKKNYCMQKVGVVFGQKTNLWIDIPINDSYRAIKQIYKVDDAVFRKNYDMVVELLSLQEILNIPARRLSLGQRMRADIGLIFLHGPELIFMDEPTLGLDINVKRTIRSFLRQANKENHTGIFLTSHDLDDIDEICEDAMVISKGSQIYNGSLEQLKQAYADRYIIKVAGTEKADILSAFPDMAVTRNGYQYIFSWSKGSYTVKEVMSKIFEFYDVNDIEVREPDIDEIVSRIFTEGVRL